MKLNSLDDLFVHHLRDLYNAEQQLTKAMPKMLAKAVNPKLKEAIQQHMTETEEQISRLEQVFGMLDVKGTGEKCKAMEGLVREGEDFMAMEADANVMDAGIIASAQRVEHYEIAGYGTACTYAKLLGNNDVFMLLSQTLDEEKATDGKLTYLAENTINRKAAH